MEELINKLDELGVDYTEDAEMGTLTINTADMDKGALVSVLQAIIAAGYGNDCDITDSSITVTGVAAAEAPVEEMPAEGGEDMMGAALDQYMQ